MKLIARKLTSTEIDEIIQVKINWILTASTPVKVILFGSAASGEMTEESDIDLIIIFNNDVDLKEVSYQLAKNRPKNDWPQDLILQTRQSFEWSVAKGGGACWLADREGKILFERETK